MTAYKIVRGKGHLHHLVATAYRRVRSAEQERIRAAQISPLTVSRPKAPLVIFSDALGDGWQNWSWASVDLAAKDPADSGKTAIRMTPDRIGKRCICTTNRSGTDGYGLPPILRCAKPRGRPPRCACLCRGFSGGAFLKGVLLAPYCRSAAGEPKGKIRVESGVRIPTGPTSDCRKIRRGRYHRGRDSGGGGRAPARRLFWTASRCCPATEAGRASTARRYYGSRWTINAEAGTAPNLPLSSMAWHSPRRTMSATCGSGLNRWGGE